MGSLGMPEILMILVVALIIFGPRKLPELGKTLGQSLAHFRKASEDFKRQWEDEVDLEKRRLDAPPPAETVQETEQASTEQAATEQAATEQAPTEQASTETDDFSLTGYPAEAYDTSHAQEPVTAATAEPATVATAPATVSRDESVAAEETKRDWM
ncbi:MAG TPA: twin-arginine translocase TatA/TatE family subunit [Blastocatellia bacterium]|nr:twin-arginine translocase TatA/TatE family subunit [Blastocatellia bacterium]